MTALVTVDQGIPGVAELARCMNRNASNMGAVHVDQAHPELPLAVAIAKALGA